MRKRFLFLMLFILLIATLGITYSSQSILEFAHPSQAFSGYEEFEQLWLDDFTSANPSWNWGYNAGTGYKNLTTIDGYSVVEGGITSEATSSQYSDNSLHRFIDVGDDESIRVE